MKHLKIYININLNQDVTIVSLLITETWARYEVTGYD